MTIPIRYLMSSYYADRLFILAFLSNSAVSFYDFLIFYLFSPRRDLPSMANVYGVIKVIDTVIISTWHPNKYASLDLPYSKKFNSTFYPCA